jgi:cyclic pyranopterin phosphate synthase
MNRVFLPILGSIQPLDAAAVPAEPLVDGFARRIRYLRVSVTDRCNYRCSYCMPEELGDQLIFENRSAVLSFEELERVVGIFARLGVRKVRLTGGEPTVRKGIAELARRLATVPGIDQLVMTSNGHLLDDLAGPLAAAGVQTINISLDTLDAAKFTQLTGRGDLARVVAGIDAALAAGMRVKINTVALRGVNDGELAELCRFAWSKGATPRFIEHMPMSGGQLYTDRAELSAAQIRAAVEAAFGALTPGEAALGDAGPDRYCSLDV